ncbi:oxygen-independent coproporphyrinogen III oxidase [Sphingopyxis sp.]|jgi:oxygen-independent coproporphyrinogen-3 oxidase|uniref:oxygen-independent coproporphyrinogen III oxidase n=1 Tax=Sphingopyxis sp. TaxID=1908224 RepID=UPI0025E9C1CF|nr:oxygen-independent coproporphyrinogen III oxidase [Sphingopyxis sp.]MBK6413830.1 oxygen-independent coproporphyrinogen III oxidase [Sphingopyxis sp.]
MWSYHPDLLATPVPRYTSYPTAVEFSDDVGTSEYAAALDRIESATPVSLYVHIPFCDQICWYCGCNTGAANRTQRLTDYLTALRSEIAMVAKRIGGRARVQRIAFGGGSPNAIAPVDFVRLLDRILTVFDVSNPEISIEIDPRGFSADWARVLAASSVRRVSLGVQTFSPQIQQAIGRLQPLADIENAVASLRLRDIDAINFDLMYGLPGQRLADLDATLDETIRLAPSRVALFGYAHLPAMIPRQRRIDASNLPDHKLRFEQAELGFDRLTEAGYVPIGFDHFALPADPLAVAAKEGRVNRNFQGFTDDDSATLLGFGASAISKFPDLIVQNEKRAGHYRDLIGEGRLSAARGVVIDADERGRGAIIRDLLCRGRARIDMSLSEAAHAALAEFESRDLIAWEGDDLVIHDSGRPYARHVAAQFDRVRGKLQVYG